jgi:hypothetical protein
LLPRFILPLLPLLALAAAGVVCEIWTRLAARRPGSFPLDRLVLPGCAALLVLLIDGPHTGTRAVLDLQPPDAVAAVRLVRQALGQDGRLSETLPPDDSLAKYSAIAHQVVIQGQASALLAVSDGSPAPDGYELIGRAGKYALYRVKGR